MSTEPSIINQIEQCKEDYRTRTGVDATRLYLGANKISELSHWLFLNTDSEFSIRTEVYGLRVVGMSLYAVKKDIDHMECGG